MSVLKAWSANSDSHRSGSCQFRVPHSITGTWWWEGNEEDKGQYVQTTFPGHSVAQRADLPPTRAYFLRYYQHEPLGTYSNHIQTQQVLSIRKTTSWYTQKYGQISEKFCWMTDTCQRKTRDTAWFYLWTLMETHKLSGYCRRHRCGCQGWRWSKEGRHRINRKLEIKVSCLGCDRLKGYTCQIKSTELLKMYNIFQI